VVYRQAPRIATEQYETAIMGTENRKNTLPSEKKQREQINYSWRERDISDVKKIHRWKFVFRSDSEGMKRRFDW
jgi:hypothetical protein